MQLRSDCYRSSSMTHPLLDRLAVGPILADGAIGTMLYAAGASLDESFDALNLSVPSSSSTRTAPTSTPARTSWRRIPLEPIASNWRRSDSPTGCTRSTRRRCAWHAKRVRSLVARSWWRARSVRPGAPWRPSASSRRRWCARCFASRSRRCSRRRRPPRAGDDRQPG